MEFRSYTGSFVYFFVDKVSGLTRMVDYVPSLGIESEAGSINLYDYLGTQQTASAPAAQPASQPVVFDGRWADEVAGRCQITLSFRSEGSWNVDISWANSAAQRVVWTMTANVYRDDILVYDDGHCWTETYTDDTTFEVSDETFNGSGSFFIQDGKLHWVNNQTGEETVLVRA